MWFFRSFFFFWAPSSREPSPSCRPQFPPSFLPRSVAHKGGGGGGALRLTGGREGLDGWMDGWMSVGHRASRFLSSVKYAACARSFVHPRDAPQWPRLSERDCARRRRVVFFRGFFFFFFVFLFITKTLKGLRRESHQWDAGSERRVVERKGPLFFPRPPALHSSGTFCSPPTPLLLRFPSRTPLAVAL